MIILIVTRLKLHERLKIRELGMFAHFIRKMRTAPKYVSGSKYVSLAKCMAMTLGSQEHCLGERMRHLENDAASKMQMLRHPKQIWIAYHAPGMTAILQLCCHKEGCPKSRAVPYKRRRVGFHTCQLNGLSKDSADMNVRPTDFVDSADKDIRPTDFVGIRPTDFVDSADRDVRPTNSVGIRPTNYGYTAGTKLNSDKSGCK